MMYFWAIEVLPNLAFILNDRPREDGTGSAVLKSRFEDHQFRNE